jgi:hypothetical protein
MKKQLLLWLLAGILVPASAEAQKEIVFESHNSSGKRSSKKEVGANSLTFGLGSFINGYNAVYYERKVLDFMSISIGGGVTYRSYMNDFGMILSNDGKQSDYFKYQDIEDDYTNYKHRTSVLGLYVSLAPKIYFSNEVMDGFYISPAIEVKQYNFKANLADVTAAPKGYYEGVDYSTGTIPEYMHCYDATINSGGHYQLRNHLAVGWSVGFGLRHQNSERLDLGIGQDAAGNQTYINHVRDYSVTRPLFTFNFVMGGWF